MNEPVRRSSNASPSLSCREAALSRSMMALILFIHKSRLCQGSDQCWGFLTDCANSRSNLRRLSLEKVNSFQCLELESALLPLQHVNLLHIGQWNKTVGRCGLKKGAVMLRTRSVWILEREALPSCEPDEYCSRRAVLYDDRTTAFSMF